MTPSLLITDLDNTLYDWVSFFAQSFRAMVDKLVDVTGTDRQQVLGEFKAVHQRYGNSEQPFAILELPSIARRFPGVSRQELLATLSEPLRAFDATRDRTLRLYDGVQSTLDEFHRRGVRIIGHTEAIGVNAYSRLRRLGLLQYFTRLYVLEGHLLPHPDPSREPDDLLRSELLRQVPRAERKPNPELLGDICRREGVPINATWYVGDSLTRDMAMAKDAGAVAVWARYGTHYDASLWNTLVSVTHWTPEDVAREAALKARHALVKPDYILDAFSQLLEIPRESESA
jgi:phosphoglycolate phosphatase-like HAD superfamily hydrolase